MMPWLGKTVSWFTGFQGSENSPPFNKASLLAGSKEFGLLAGYVYEGFRTGTAAQKKWFAGVHCSLQERLRDVEVLDVQTCKVS